MHRVMVTPAHVLLAVSGDWRSMRLIVRGGHHLYHAFMQMDQGVNEFSPAASHQVRMRVEGIQFSFPEHQDARTSAPQADLAIGRLIDRAGTSFSRSIDTIISYLRGVEKFSQGSASIAHSAFLLTVCAVLEEQQYYVGQGRPKICDAVFKVRILGENGAADTVKEIEAEVYSQRVFRQLRHFEQSANVSTSILAATTLQHIVNCFESLMADLVRIRCRAFPKSISGERKLTYAEILAAKSVEDLKQSVVEGEVAKFVMSSIEDQLKTIDNFAGSELSRRYGNELDEVADVFLARNVMVHADSVASEEYVRRRRELKKHWHPMVSVGDRLRVTIPMVERACEAIWVAGLLACELVWKRLAKAGERQARSDAEAFIVREGFTVLARQCFVGAEMLYKHGASTWSDDGRRNIAKINAAQCLRWRGLDGWRSSVDAQSWIHAAPVFRLCAAAIRGDLVEFEKLLPLAKADPESFNVADLFDWPVFHWVREQPGFPDVVRRQFGELPEGMRDPIGVPVLAEPEIGVTLTVAPIMLKKLGFIA